MAFTLLELFKAAARSKQRGLAATARPEDRDDFTLGYGNAQPVKDRPIAQSHGSVAQFKGHVGSSMHVHVR